MAERQSGLGNARLQLDLLGGFTARDDAGREISIGSRKAQALLAFLALSPGKPQPREKLTGLLWSDRGEAQARSSLRQALSELRKALPEDDPPLLITQRDGVWLNPEAIQVDAVILGRLVDGGEPEDLAKAAELYKGDFLDGLDVRDAAFEDWRRSERSQLRDRTCQALAILMDQQSGDQAIATARRLIALDPLNEATHRRLMRLYANKGDRTAALKQFQACQELLAAELGVEPEPATKELRDQIVRKGEPATTLPGPVSRAADLPSIAVLPFQNLSGDPDQEYFAEGMTRDLVTEFGRFATLRVISTTALFADGQRRVSAAEMRRDLNVQYVLEGSVRKADRHIRVTAQLTDAETGQQVWGDRFDGDLGDIFEIQDAITRRIASNLYQPLMEYGSRKARQRPAASGYAYDLYLRAWHYIEFPARDTVMEARQLCRSALEIDPNFALAYELLMWTDLHEALNGWTEDPESKLHSARRELARGIALDPKNQFLRGSLGFIEVLLGNEERGLKELEAAVAFVPSDAIYHVLYGGALAFAGRAEQALEVLKEAERLSPRYHVTRLFEGEAYFVAGRDQEAIPCFQQFLTVDPHCSLALLYLAACQVELEEIEAARQTVLMICEESPDMTQSYVRKLLRARDPVLVDRLLRTLQDAGLPE